MHERAIRRAAALTAAAVLLVAGGAFADTVAPNPDAITLEHSGAVDLGTVAPGAVIPVDVPLRLTCSGTAHVTNGESAILTFAAATVPGDGAVSPGDGTVGPVSGFPSDGSACSDPPQVVSSGTPIHVTLIAPTTPNAPGTRYTYELMYSGSTSDGDTAAVPHLVFVDLVLTVVGDLPPTLTLPGSMTVEGDEVGGAVVSYTATASDPEDGSLSPDCSPASGAFFPLGSTTVDCTATDSAGHRVSGSFDVTVVDTTPPSLGPLGPVDLTTTDPAGTTASYALPTAVDLVDPSPVVSCAPAPGTWLPLGTTSVACTATDASGNTASASFALTVSYDPPASYGVVFDEPIGPTGAVVVNPGRTLPVKATILRDGVAVTSGSVDVVLTACGSTVPLGAPATMSLRNDRWVLELDTTGLPACARGTVRLEGVAVGGFDLSASTSSLVRPLAKGRQQRP